LWRTCRVDAKISVKDLEVEVEAPTAVVVEITVVVTPTLSVVGIRPSGGAARRRSVRVVEAGTARRSIFASDSLPGAVHALSTDLFPR